MDNLETNTAMMRELEILFTQREIPYDARNYRIFCFPHIINIIVQHVVDKFSSPSGLKDNSSKNENPGRPYLHPETIEEACACCPLQRARKIIVTIRSSGQRRDQWIKWINTGKKNNVCLYIVTNMLLSNFT